MRPASSPRARGRCRARRSSWRDPPAGGPRTSGSTSLNGGQTWTTTPPTLQAKTVITGLTPVTTVEFRYRAVLKDGADNWSEPVSLTVS